MHFIYLFRLNRKPHVRVYASPSVCEQQRDVKRLEVHCSRLSLTGAGWVESQMAKNNINPPFKKIKAYFCKCSLSIQGRTPLRLLELTFSNLHYPHSPMSPAETLLSLSVSSLLLFFFRPGEEASVFKCSVSRETECSRVGKQSFIITLGCNSVLLQFSSPAGTHMLPPLPGGHTHTHTPHHDFRSKLVPVRKQFPASPNIGNIEQMSPSSPFVSGWRCLQLTSQKAE